MTITEHKCLEYLGDALYNFLCREIVLDGDFSFDKNSEKRKIAMYIQSNNFQAAVAINMGIIPHPDKMDALDVYGNNSPYPYADQLEVELYQVFLGGGYEAAKNFFIKNVLPHCQTLKEARMFDQSKIIPKYITDNV